MIVKSGDIRQFTYGGRELAVKGGDANVVIKLGGYTMEAEVDGNGKLSGTSRRAMAQVSDIPLRIDDSKQDLEYLQGKADSQAKGETEGEALTLTLASGITYSGTMLITGEITKATGDGMCSPTFVGEKFEQI